MTWVDVVMLAAVIGVLDIALRVARWTQRLILRRLDPGRHIRPVRRDRAHHP